ncbi:MAG: NB-ARC domain-containing protein [Cyanobacteria bacterium P01_F01_bin.150]
MTSRSNSNRSKRRRGVVLTIYGEQKLRGAIAHAETEENFGQKLTLEELGDRTGLNPTTIAKVLDCKQRADQRSIKRFFQAFDLELTDDDICQLEARKAQLQQQLQQQTQEAPESDPPFTTPQIDWGEAVDVPIFYGRTAERTTLASWILEDQCRLVALLGMGGMGKTALSVKLSEEIQSKFDYFIWRSLREAPPVEKILADLLKFVSNQQETELADTLGDSVTRLIYYLQQSRCLLVLDNAESILQGGTQAGQYREGYKDYGTLIQRIGESRHQSCLVITSREKPKELARLAGPRRPVRTLLLQGLENDAGQAFLAAEGLEDGDRHWKQIFDYYSGNPLALKIAANTIQDLFGGDINAFLNQGAGVFGDIRDLLEQQFKRLSDMGQSVLYWLAINREPVSIEELKDDILEPISSLDLLETLESLRRRSLVERTDEGFTLQNVVMEYLTSELIQEASNELKTQKINRLHSHALLKALSQDYVRATQIRLILEPLIANFSNLEQYVKTSLETIRCTAAWAGGYASGNLLNVLCQSQDSVCDFDFSKLTLRQSHLEGMTLHRLNFANSHFFQSTFSSTFGNVQAVAFSPNSELFALGDRNGNIQLWTFAGRRLITTVTEHNHGIRSLTFSSDGQLLVSSSGDSTCRLWDLQTFQCLHIFYRYHEGHSKKEIGPVVFSPDDRLIASGISGHTICLWDVHTHQCVHVFSDHTGDVHSLAFSPNGQFLISGSRDSTVRLWDVQNHKCLAVFQGHRNSVMAIAFSPNGELFASGSQDHTIRLWNIQQHKCIHIFSEHQGAVEALAFDPNSNFLVSGSDDHTIRLWDMQNYQCLYVFSEHTDEVKSVALSNDGQLLLSGSEDTTVRLWDVQTRQCLEVLAGYTDAIWSVAFSPDGQWLASGGNNAEVRLWNMQNLKCLHVFSEHRKWVKAVTFSPDGQFLASSSGDLTIRLRDMQNYKCLHVFPENGNWVGAVVFNSDGRLLANGSEDAAIRLWNIKEGQCLRVLHGHTERIDSVAFSPEAQLLASGSRDSTIRLWNLTQCRCLSILEGHTEVVREIAFSPDGRFLASCSSDTTIRLWDIQQRKCVHIFEDHTNWVASVAFSPDGRILATSSEDRTIRLWDMHSYQCLHVLTGHTNWIWSVAFHPDGQILASASHDGTIRLWDVRSGLCLNVLRAPRPYEGTDITNVKGLSKSQQDSMLVLGAIVCPS